MGSYGFPNVGTWTRLLQRSISLSGQKLWIKLELKDQLAAKEGLALINGTTVLTGIGALATYDGIQLLKLSDIRWCSSMEVHNGITSPFEEDLHTIRPQSGQLATARNIRNLLRRKQNTTVATQQRVKILIHSLYSSNPWSQQRTLLLM